MSKIPSGTESARPLSVTSDWIAMDAQCPFYLRKRPNHSAALSDALGQLRHFAPRQSVITSDGAASLSRLSGDPNPNVRVELKTIRAIGGRLPTAISDLAKRKISKRTGLGPLSQALYLRSSRSAGRAHEPAAT
jgi:hypothetical protein